jgi:hypothetical protein
MSTEIDINFPEDLRPSVVARICKTLMQRHSRQSKPTSSREDDEITEPSDLEDEDEGAESESEKLAALHSEKHGAPAPLPVKETDFREGDLRKTIRKLPPAIRKKGKKA